MVDVESIQNCRWKQIPADEFKILRGARTGRLLISHSEAESESFPEARRVLPALQYLGGRVVERVLGISGWWRLLLGAMRTRPGVGNMPLISEAAVGDHLIQQTEGRLDPQSCQAACWPLLHEVVTLAFARRRSAHLLENCRQRESVDGKRMTCCSA